MFTTEPALAQRIERMIGKTPIVDPHTHIRCDEPNAPDLASLMSYHWVQTELRAVGMPASDCDVSLPADERVRRTLPYLKRMRNTAMAWCLYRIFRDLYDFHEGHLTEANYRGLFDRVLATGRDATWPRHVLRDRANIQTVVTSLGNRSAISAKNPDYVYYMLDAHYLFCPGVATDLTPFFENRTRRSEYYDALCALFGGVRPATCDQLETLLFDWLDKTVRDRVRFSNTFIPIEQRFLAPELAVTELALNRGAADRVLSDSDIAALVRFVTWKVLTWHHEHRKAFQIAVGAEYFICDGKSIPRFQQTWTSEMARALHQFSGCRFDLMMASDVLTHEVAVLARQFPNVYASGYWWHNFFPSLIEKVISLRMQVAPMTKFSGFLCDAYYAEWSYGKLQVVKKALASALAHLVEAGYYEEEDLPPILHQVLHDTPRDLYDLTPSPD
jgi:glucuronate isomerase